MKFHIVLGSHISFQLSCFVGGLFTLKRSALPSLHQRRTLGSKKFLEKPVSPSLAQNKSVITLKFNDTDRRQFPAPTFSGNTPQTHRAE